MDASETTDGRVTTTGEPNLERREPAGPHSAGPPLPAPGTAPPTGGNRPGAGNDRGGSAAEGDRAEAVERRLRSVRDYESAALAKADPLSAMIGMVAAGFAEQTVLLSEAIRRSLAGGGGSPLEHIERVMPALEVELKLGRQLERYALMERVAEAPSPPPFAPPFAFPFSLPVPPHAPRAFPPGDEGR